jgi:chromosome segregation ATPase
MTEPATSAVAQLEQVRAAITAIDGELIEAAHDGQRYAQLIARRSAMTREVERVQYAVEFERRQQDAAHKAALRERFGDAVSTAAAIRQEGAALDAQIRDLLADFDKLLRQGDELTRRHAAAVAQPANAQAGLRQLGEPPPSGGVGDWRCPGQDAALAAWISGHRALVMANLSPSGAAAISALQHARVRG